MPQSNMSDRADVRAAQAVLSEANHAHGTQFKLNHRFDDGVQSGAWLLLDDNGRRAVLKWSPVRDWARQIERAAGGSQRSALPGIRRPHGSPSARIQTASDTRFRTLYPVAARTK